MFWITTLQSQTLACKACVQRNSYHKSPKQRNSIFKNCAEHTKNIETLYRILSKTCNPITSLLPYRFLSTMIKSESVLWFLYISSGRLICRLSLSLSLCIRVGIACRTVIAISNVASEWIKFVCVCVEWLDLLHYLIKNNFLSALAKFDSHFVPSRSRLPFSVAPFDKAAWIVMCR